MPLPIKIEHRIGVQAPAEVIWGIISDLSGWAAWNPLYPRADGALRIGSALTLDVAMPGEEKRTIQPVVVDWVPNEQILWRTRGPLGLLTAVRYIEIEALSEASCIFSNGEIFEGLMIRFFPRPRRRRLKAGFTLLGEAVRERAEAAFRAAGDGAT